MSVLAVLSFFGGFLPSFFKSLEEVFPEHELKGLAFGLDEHFIEWGVTLIVIALASFTIYLYMKKQKVLQDWAAAFSKVSAAGQQEYHVNTFLVGLGTGTVKILSAMTSMIDTKIIDDFLNSLAGLVQKVSSKFSKIQQGVPQTYMLYIVVGAIILIYWIVGA